MIITKVCGCIALVACAVFAGDVWADVTSNPPDTELEQIIVTASKRSEDIREVPVSISVIRGEDLQQLHIVDFTDLSQSKGCVIFREYKKTKIGFWVAAVTAKSHGELEVVESTNYDLDQKVD
jgi:outer membrane receptor for ferrienterochelin and colicin